MKVIFLTSAAEDLLWFRSYYANAFPAGRERAKKQLKKFCQLLEANPYAGRAGRIGNVRELHIPKTPFKLIYRVTPRHIEILRLWDERQGRFD